MKLRILSDIHAEFSNGNYNLPIMEDEANTILCYAGDLGVAGRALTYCSILEDWCGRFQNVLYIPGNHEHYKSSIARSVVKIKRNLAFECGDTIHNLYFDDKFSVVIDDTAFICATLWTDMDNGNPVCMSSAELSMNDYRVIRSGPSEDDPYKWKLKPVHTMGIYKRHKEFIFEELAKHQATGLKTVVMTHHAPSFQSVASCYVSSDVNGAYASELYDAYGDQPMPSLHIHGHVHDSFDYMLDKTRVLCNPRGYVPNDVNPNYNPELVVEL